MSQLPSLLLVMRHAEKPADPRDPNLTPAGKARAEQLADYIPNHVARPDFIFAAAVSAHSARSVQTMTPLSDATGISIDSTFADQDYSAIAADILTGAAFADKTGVMCWHHGNIPSLMAALGAPPGTYPDPWDPAVFNLILAVDFANDTVVVRQIVEPF